MNKVKKRAAVVLILAGMLAAAVLWYTGMFFKDGGTWAAFPSNKHLYSAGSLSVGTVLDRDGTVLAGEKDGQRVWAESRNVRLSTLHLLGDPAGNIGTGILNRFGSRMIGYSPVSGLFSKKNGTMTLTVDADINAAAYRAMNGASGAAIMYNYKTGEVLADVSAPTYDPADPPKSVEDDPALSGVYLNRAISATYPPGSTMKIVTLAAATENMPDLYERKFTCKGTFNAGDMTITCPHVHGDMTIEEAFASSCNCVFAQLSLELGGKTLQKYAEGYKLTSSIGIDGISTAAGRFDAAADGSGDLGWSGVGQSTDLVCAANMMVMAGAVGNGGNAVMPTILGGSTSRTRYMSAETAKSVGAVMRHATVSVYGDSRFAGYSVCAKSGTAQLADGDSHAWFVGYCENEDCPVAFAVVLEHGGAGSRAAADVVSAMLTALAG